MLFMAGWLAIVSAKSQTIEIKGLNPIGKVDTQPVYFVKEPSITISLTSARTGIKFVKSILVDEIEVASAGSDYYSYWSSYTLNISEYFDGALHLLKVYNHDYGYDTCYFGNEDAIINIHNIWYGIIDGTARVITCSDEIEEANIPSKLVKDGVEYPITSIESEAFKDCDQLKSVTIPNSISSIGSNAFRSCKQLTSITIPNSVISIGASAFYGCIQLKSITIPNSVIYIDSSAFYGCNQLQSVTIPNSVTHIGSNAFYGCSSMKSLTLGSGLIDIGSKAFDNTSIIKAMWLANTPPSNYNSVNAMVHYVVNDQYTLLSNKREYTFLNSKFGVDGIVYVPITPSERTCDVIDCNYTLENGNVNIGDKVINRGVELSVRNINEYSFYENQTITCLSANNNGYIGSNAFYNCDALTSVSLKNNGNIEERAFYDCDGLFKLIAANNGDIGNDAFYDCQGLTEAEITAHGSIGSNAFMNCNALLKSRIENVGEICSHAFYGCNLMNEATLGDSISSIGNYAFAGCSALTTVSIPDNVTSIGDYVFSSCNRLESVRFGIRVSKIPVYAFYNCSLLDNVSIPYNIGEINDCAFFRCTSLSHLRFEEGIRENHSEHLQQTFDDWTSMNHSDNSTTDKDYTFSVIAGDILTFDYSVESEVNCDFLIAKINGNQILKESGNKTGSFSKTFETAETITLNVAYTKDGSYNSGQDYASVYNIMVNGVINDELQLGSSEPSSLFEDCPLEDVYIGRNLKYSTAPDTGYSPFFRNQTLRSVEISDEEIEIYDNEFFGCKNLKTLKIGNGVKTIGKWAFAGCSSLDYFSAGYNVESIGEEAFSDCIGLTNYYSFSAEPPVCGSQALDDINKWDCTLHVPAGSSDRYMAADKWKDFFFINEADAVLAESIRLNSESLDGLTGESFQLVASILPANATRKSVTWSSTNPEVVTVDSEGLASFINEGEAVITAMTTDGSGIEASINVMVRIKEPELGDSNANGVVNIADVVNIANYVIGNDVEHFNAAASDVNKDGKISMADAMATVTIILNQDVTEASSAMAKARARALDSEADLLVVDNFYSKTGETASVFVTLENSVDYVALQADVTVPEGMTLIDVKPGNRAAHHSLTSRHINERAMRISLFNPGSNAFANNSEAVLELVVKVNAVTTRNIELSNILASDAQANEYTLTSAGAHNTEMSGITGVDGDCIHVNASAGVINISNAEGCEITILAVDGTVISRFTASSVSESRRVANGVYMVVVGNVTEKVVVK